MKLKYSNYKLISDIGSSINLNRKGLRKIIDEAILGKINEVIIVHKDRLCKKVNFSNLLLLSFWIWINRRFNSEIFKWKNNYTRKINSKRS